MKTSRRMHRIDSRRRVRHPNRRRRSTMNETPQRDPMQEFADRIHRYHSEEQRCRHSDRR